MPELTKRCTCCKVVKPLTGFVIRKRPSGPRPDSWCKLCYCAKALIRSSTPQGKEAQTLYNRSPKARAAQRAYRKAKKGKLNSASRVRAWRGQNPEKKAAYEQVESAIKSGRLIKPSRCEECGKKVLSRHLHAHHHYGYKPEHVLDVIFLCVTCHGLTRRLWDPSELAESSSNP